MKGERSSNGIVAAIFCVYSYAFVGAAKVQFSGGQKGDETNNVFLAAVSHVWVAARQGDPDWLGKLFREFFHCFQSFGWLRRFFHRSKNVEPYFP